MNSSPVMTFINGTNSTLWVAVVVVELIPLIIDYWSINKNTPGLLHEPVPVLYGQCDYGAPYGQRTQSNPPAWLVEKDVLLGGA